MYSNNILGYQLRPDNKEQRFLASKCLEVKKNETNPEKPTYTVLGQPKNSQNQICEIKKINPMTLCDKQLRMITM